MTANIVGPTMLGFVVSVLAVVCKRMQQLPTICNTKQGVQTDETCNIQQCMELLANKALRPFVWGVWTPYFYLNKAWLSDSTKLI